MDRLQAVGVVVASCCVSFGLFLISRDGSAGLLFALLVLQYMLLTAWFRGRQGALTKSFLWLISPICIFFAILTTADPIGVLIGIGYIGFGLVAAALGQLLELFFNSLLKRIFSDHLYNVTLIVVVGSTSLILVAGA